MGRDDPQVNCRTRVRLAYENWSSMRVTNPASSMIEPSLSLFLPTFFLAIRFLIPTSLFNSQQNSKNSIDYKAPISQHRQLLSL